jgi:hypothetical protein
LIRHFAAVCDFKIYRAPFFVEVNHYSNDTMHNQNLSAENRKSSIFLACYACILLVVAPVFSAKAQIALPPDLPPFTVELDDTTAADGYLFTSVLNIQAPTADYPSSVLLYDKDGALVFYLPFSDDSEAPYAREAVGDFKVHPDGRMSFTDKLFGEEGSIYIMDSTFTIIDTLNCTPQYELDGHDFVITADGHYHLLAMEERIMDASALITESNLPGDTACVVIGHIIQEFDQNGNLVNEWKSLDHFALADTYWYYFTDPAGMDHAHVNSLFVDHDGNYVISCHSLDEITRINRQTGQIIWRLGGKNNQFAFLGDTARFMSQHDAQYFPDGTLLLFDNGSYNVIDKPSRMIVYELDEVNMTATDTYIYEHPADLISGFMGSARLLPDDHFVISWGGGFPYALGASIQEFDALLHDIVKIDFMDGYVCYRAIKSELPWSLNRPEIICNTAAATLSAGGQYDSYYWSTGDSTASITITAPGTYQLWTNAGDGFMSSLPFEVIDAANLCMDSVDSGIGIDSKFKNQLLTVYPNPAQDQFTIEWPEGIQGTHVMELHDLQGRIVYSKEVEITGATSVLNLDEFASGIYHLRVANEHNVMTQRVSIVH